MHKIHSGFTKRLNSLDALRGLAVLLMVEQHLGIWLWKQYYRLYDHPFMLCFNGLGGFAAPAFITLAGLGCAFLQYRHTDTDRILVVRGLLLIGFGYLLNIVIPSWFSYGSWYVLHLIGFSILLTPILRRLPTATIIILCIVILIATVCIQNGLDTPLKISNRRMATVDLAGGVFRLILAEGHFPLFPWLAFFLAGILSGRWLIQGTARNIIRLAAALLGIGMLLTSCNLLGLSFAVQEPLMRACRFLPRIYPALTPVVLLLMSLALFSIAVITALESRRSFKNANPLVCLGRSSLTILFVHTVLFRQVSRYLDFWRVFSLGETLAIMCGVLVLFALLAVVWNRYGYRYGAEWAMRKIAG